MSQTLILLVIMVVIYAAILLPQQRRQKRTNEMLGALQEGDEVVMNSGVHGFIAEIDGDIVWLDVDPDTGTTLTISRSSIAGVVPGSSADEADDGDDE